MDTHLLIPAPAAYPQHAPKQPAQSLKIRFLIFAALFFFIGLRCHANEGPEGLEELETFYEEQLRAFPSKPAPPLRKAKQLQLKGNKKALRYRTSLTWSWSSAEEPNFAGRYFVPEDIGCGTECRVIFIVDWNTGRIMTPPQNHSYFRVERTSRLIILNAFPHCTAFGSPILYTFDGAKFKEIKHDKCQ